MDVPIIFLRTFFILSSFTYSRRMATPIVIKILFYAPGTGFGTTIKNIPYTVAHATFGDAEVTKQKLSKSKFDIASAFTVRRALKDNRMIPGYIQLADQHHISDPDNQMIFDSTTGSTAGHTYQRLVDFVIASKELNRKKVKFFSPIYSIYTVVDAPGSNTNLSFLFDEMKNAGYPDTFFDVCITASKGISSLVPTIEHFNMDTTLVLINGGADGYLTDVLSVGSKVRAVVLTQGDNDAQIVNKKFITTFLNGNKTKIFIYSNKKDGHNQASLILGDTSTLDDSLVTKTNRQFRHSYLPLLVNSVYYVGRKRSSWAYLSKILSHDRFINNSDFLMVGGMTEMKGGMIRSQQINNCGCGSTPVQIPENRSNSTLSMRQVLELYCDCDKNHITNILHGGADPKNTEKHVRSDQINKDNLNEHLYPETNDDPFSDLVESPINKDTESENPVGQFGGNLITEDHDIVGKTLSEIIYHRNKMDYVHLSEIILNSRLKNV